ncbi:MAG: kelch repeat-containing protein [Polyangiaceae bacterium]
MSLPARADGAFRLQHRGVTLAVTLLGASPTARETIEDLVVYRSGYGDGRDVIHRVTERGTEDFVRFPHAPSDPRLRYRIDLADGAAGLRLVSRTLEVLDAAGAPRLRVAPPYVVDANGKRHAASLGVEGCAFDASPAPPWGRPVTSPGARSCVVRVDWDVEASHYPVLVDPSWETTGEMSVPRQLHTATTLANGRVLVAGGTSEPAIYDSAELYDPGTETWSTTGSLSGPRRWHTATALGDGRVVVVGGHGYGGTSYGVPEIYDPTAGTWSPMGSVVVERNGHSTSLLQDGRLLVAGGIKNTPPSFDTAVLFDPMTESWSSTASMAVAHSRHRARVLQDGRVLVTGGLTGTSMSPAELYDPASETWSAAGQVQAWGGHTATLLDDGRVLVVGGIFGGAPNHAPALYDPVTNTWTGAAQILQPRTDHTATLLDDGRVLVVGGRGASLLATAEIYDPVANAWLEAGSMETQRESHVACRLLDGRVLVSGGANFDFEEVTSAEIFDPGLPLGTPCTEAADCASTFCVDGLCCESACGDGASDDCLACSLAAGSSADGTCDMLTDGSVECRPAADDCDVAEVCDGTAGASCPADALAPDGTACETGVCNGGICEDTGEGGARSEGGASPGGGSPPSGYQRVEAGCGCRTAPPSQSTWPTWLGAVALGALGLRRRGSTRKPRPAPKSAKLSA